MTFLFFREVRLWRGKLQQVSSELWQWLCEVFYFIGGRRLTATCRRLRHVFARCTSNALPRLCAAASPHACRRTAAPLRFKAHRGASWHPCTFERSAAACRSGLGAEEARDPAARISLRQAHLTHRARRLSPPVTGARIDCFKGRREHQTAASATACLRSPILTSTA